MLKNTTDIWFTAFLMYKGHKILKFDKLSKGKGKFYFDLSDEEWSNLKLEFNNTEFIKFKSLIEQVKDLCY